MALLTGSKAVLWARLYIRLRERVERKTGGAKMARRAGRGLGLWEKGRRASRSSRTSMKHGLVGLVLIRKVDGFVLARREDDVAQHLAAARALAFHMDHKGGALALLAQDGAQAEHGVDVARRDRHARHAGVRTVRLAGLIFRIGADEREVVLPLHRRCERRQRENAEHASCKLDHLAPPPETIAGDFEECKECRARANDQFRRRRGTRSRARRHDAAGVAPAVELS